MVNFGANLPQKNTRSVFSGRDIRKYVYLCQKCKDMAGQNQKCKVRAGLSKKNVKFFQDGTRFMQIKNRKKSKFKRELETEIVPPAWLTRM